MASLRGGTIPDTVCKLTYTILEIRSMFQGLGDPSNAPPDNVGKLTNTVLGIRSMYQGFGDQSSSPPDIVGKLNEYIINGYYKHMIV